MRDPRKQMIARIAKTHARADVEAGVVPSNWTERVSIAVPDFDPESDDTIYYQKAYRLWRRLYEQTGMEAR